MNVEISRSSKTVCKDGNPIAIVTMDTPLFTDGRAAKRLSCYYNKAEAVILKFLENLPGPLSKPIEIRLTVTQNVNDILSLYRDISIGSNTVRIADTWKNGYPISFKDFGKKKKDIIKRCTDEAEILERSGYIPLFHDYRKLIRKKYRPECFYIQDGKIIFFYEAGAIAGKSQGIMKFSIS